MRKLPLQASQEQDLVATEKLVGRHGHGGEKSVKDPQPPCRHCDENNFWAQQMDLTEKGEEDIEEYDQKACWENVAAVVSSEPLEASLSNSDSLEDCARLVQDSK